MTIAAYQTLYESSVAFGMRKALQAEQGKSDMEKKVVTVSPRFSHLLKKKKTWVMHASFAVQIVTWADCRFGE